MHKIDIEELNHRHREEERARMTWAERGLEAIIHALSPMRWSTIPRRAFALLLPISGAALVLAIVAFCLLFLALVIAVACATALFNTISSVIARFADWLARLWRGPAED